jgi:lactate 2-monooxygenase
MLLNSIRYKISQANLTAYGMSIGLSDPVFMRRFNRETTHQPPRFPYSPAYYDQMVNEGLQEALEDSRMSSEWLGELKSEKKFRTWKDLASLRELWKGTFVIKGIQAMQVRHIHPNSRCANHHVNRTPRGP